MISDYLQANISLNASHKVITHLQFHSHSHTVNRWRQGFPIKQQESPAIADKPARRESMPKIAPLRRAYNVVADNTGLSSCV